MKTTIETGHQGAPGDNYEHSVSFEPWYAETRWVGFDNLASEIDSGRYGEAGVEDAACDEFVTLFCTGNK